MRSRCSISPLEVYALKPGTDGVIRVSDAHLVSVRRALRSLEKAGKAYRVGRSRSTYWVNERAGLAATIHNTRCEIRALVEESGTFETDPIRALSTKLQPLFDRARALGLRY